jgi:uncharacterized protein
MSNHGSISAASQQSSTFEVERIEVRFASGDSFCAAFLYRPVVAGAVPCVVTGHGFSGTRDLGLPAYAERFAAAGLAVLLFDYRHFGASGGEPRQLIDIKGQLEDYHAAVRFARECVGVDPRRIALWGTSLGGGHVLAVAAADPRIAAVIAQVPFVGIEYGRPSPRSTRTTLKLFTAAASDVLGSIIGRPPRLIPVVGATSEAAAFPDVEAKAVLDALATTAPEWRNAVAARVLFALLPYRPGRAARRLRMPLLVCVATRDTAGSVKLAVRAAHRAPRGELRRYDAGHWDVYCNPTLDRVAADELTFLCTHLFATVKE